MQTTGVTFERVKLLVDLNWDRILWPASIAVALYVGGYFSGL